MYLKGGRCTEECGAGFYADDARECQRCHADCRTFTLAIALTLTLALALALTLTLTLALTLTRCSSGWPSAARCSQRTYC